MWKLGECGDVGDVGEVEDVVCVGDGGVVGRGVVVLRRSMHSNQRYAIHPEPISER